MGEKIDIPKDMAIKICDEIREESKNKRFSFLGYGCLGCNKFSEGKNEKMIWNKNPGNSGCYLVNARYLNEKYKLPNS